MSGDVYPFDREFYSALRGSAPSWRKVSRTIVPAGRGYGCRVRAGQTVRLEMVERAQIIDLDVFSADEPDEYLHAPTQLYVEGGRVTVGTRLWSTPPRTRPLATVIEDRIARRDATGMLRDHKSYGAHCNPHQWLLFAGRLPRTCYDNLSAGCRMVGLSPARIHDNLNLYMKSALDPATGRHLNVTSDAGRGDFIEFYAEMDILLVLSLCPYGDGSVVPEDWATTDVPVSPVAVQITETGVTPEPWAHPPSSEKATA